MPGRDSYGPSGRWIHDRAHHIMGKNPSMSKSIAYAVATQQAHKVGKSPRSFRTAEGVRQAKAKHPLPKKFYKKTASERLQKVALDRLKALVKEAKAREIGRRIVKFRSSPVVRRGATVSGAAKLPPKAPVHQLHVPAGMKAKNRGRLERAIGGGAPMKAVPTLKTRAKGIAGRLADRAGMELAGRLRGAALAPVSAGIADLAVPAAIPKAVPKAVPKKLSPRASKALRGAGTIGLGLTGGAVGHQLAYSTGMSPTGPADVIANLVVPSEQ